MSTQARVLADNVDIEVSLAPESQPAPVVHVTVTVRPDDLPLTTWMAKTALQLAANPTATDARGNVPLSVSTAATGTTVTLERPTDGVLRLAYDVKADLPAFPNPPSIAVDPDRFEGAGQAMILVPAPLAEKSLRAVIRIETDDVGTAELVGAASSFGHGSKVEASVRGSDLQLGFYMAGLMGRASFRAPEGNDDAAWLGYTAFDPRPAFADMTSLRTALRQTFRSPDTDKLTLLILSDSRPANSFSVTRRPRSVVARVGVQEPWTAPLRIAVATSVVHGWIGSRLWIGPDDAEHEAEAYWFTEGIARHFARDLLFRYGLISATEAAADVEGLAAILATSPAASLTNAELGKKPRGALPVLIARGALYALRVDALLRSRKEKKSSLERVLADLYQKASQEKKALPVSSWIDLLVSQLGENERAVFRDVIESGKPVTLPDNAMGPCFKRVNRTYEGFDIGFDEEASNASKPRKVKGLVKGGPAEKAGLVEGDSIASISVGARSPNDDVIVSVQRGEEIKSFKYKPKGKSGKGPGFDRKKDVSDDACTQ